MNETHHFLLKKKKDFKLVFQTGSYALKISWCREFYSRLSCTKEEQ